MDNFLYQLENLICPICGSSKVEPYTLGSGKIGIWCDDCLSGIPNFNFPAGDNLENAISIYKNYQDSLNMEKDR